MIVVVTNQVKSPDFVNHPAFLSPVTADGKLQPHVRLSAKEDLRWTPGKSTDGPLTLLMSRYDQRLIVSRNGIEIGRAKISISDPTDSIGTYVYVAQVDNRNISNAKDNHQTSIKWLAHPLRDANYGSNNHGDALQQLDRIKIPDDFLRMLQPSLTEGSTMIITDAPILRKNTGKDMAVLTSHMVP
jgi:hypothetical protein